MGTHGFSPLLVASRVTDELSSGPPSLARLNPVLSGMAACVLEHFVLTLLHPILREVLILRRLLYQLAPFQLPPLCTVIPRHIRIFS